MSRQKTSRSGYVFKGTIGTLALVVAIYMVMSAFGMRKVLVKTAQASQLRPENRISDRFSYRLPDVKMKYNCVSSKNINHYGSNIIVEGKIDGKSYPVRLDTGLGFADVCISSNVLSELNLSFSPKGKIWSDTTGGICYINQLDLGDIVVSLPRSVYIDQYWENQVFGVSVDQDSQISVGLGILSQFSYISVDNKLGKVTFDKEAFFVPVGAGWSKYSISIENGRFNQPRLMVTMPVADLKVKMIFDTCGGKELKLQRQCWEPIKENVGRYRVFQGQVNFGQFGARDCSNIAIDKLKIGNIEILDTNISVLDGMGPGSENILPMGVFAGRSVVLDFKNNYLWVR